LQEELNEYKKSVAMGAGSQLLDPDNVHSHMAQALDGLVDLVYVALGTAYLHGFDFREAWRRVHFANMNKVRASQDGSDSKRGSSYDVIKPPGWRPPDHSDLVLPRARKVKVLSD
jgi:predicted HAD superfamily Cof-like phosphohydrolase